MIYYIFELPNGNITSLCGNTYIEPDGSETSYVSDIMMNTPHKIIDCGRCKDILEIKSILKNRKDD